MCSRKITILFSFICLKSIFQIAIITSILSVSQVRCYWDIASTTFRMPRSDDTPRRSFFRWQWVATTEPRFWYYDWDWDDIERRRRLNVVAGISIDFYCLSTAVIMNRRVLISAYNYLDPHLARQHDLRIWCLGRTGLHYTPYRYRVLRVMKVIPKSLNPEHCHGPRCMHSPRHDISIIWSVDQMYIYSSQPYGYHYAYRSMLCDPYAKLPGDLWFAGSGYEFPEHVVENYKIFYGQFKKEDIVDCSTVLPKWWGKFFCIKNLRHYSGVQNGGGFFAGYDFFGVGCFEIRYNHIRLMVFTDLRYYHYRIRYVAYLTPGTYYEYAYPQWGIKLGNIMDGSGNNPYIPNWQIMDDFYPLG